MSVAKLGAEIEVVYWVGVGLMSTKPNGALDSMQLDTKSTRVLPKCRTETAVVVAPLESNNSMEFG